MQISDREKWVLGVIGSIATLGIGYLIWRHEAAITAQNNAQQASAQAANDQAYAQELEQALSVGGGTSQTALGGGGGYIGASTTTGATIDATGGTNAANSDLASILAAFFPQGTASTSNNGSVPGGNNATPAPPSLPPSLPQPGPVEPGLSINGSNEIPIEQTGYVNQPVSGGPSLPSRPRNFSTVSSLVN